MSKFYSVKVGRNPGVYTSWAECQAQTKGFSKAIFKSFSTREEALQFLHVGQANNNNTPAAVPMTNDAALLEAIQPQIQPYYETMILPTVATKDFANADKSILNTSDRLCVIYIDGSKRPTVNHRGMGSYCRYNFKDYYMSQPITREITDRYEIKPDDFEKLSSPAMEYICFAEVLFRFIQFRVREVEQMMPYTYTILDHNGFVQTIGDNKLMKVPRKLDPPVEIVFVSDYIGVKAFTDGSWTPKEDYIKKIRDSSLLIIKFLADKGINVRIRHIGGHLGHLGNELSDVMAKSQNFFDTIPQLVKDMTDKFM